MRVLTLSGVVIAAGIAAGACAFAGLVAQSMKTGAAMALAYASAARAVAEARRASEKTERGFLF
jgi:hypothetical protein